ncbi:MAG TPA: hypothetical protein VM597_40700, partial [Gemmataceae bacterium]|nr:hypothetical protein [Gemmataceae bacterium]
ADPGHRARRELDYLRNWLPPARQGLDYPNWQIDVAALADQAVAANELDRVYYGVWLSVLFALPIFLGVAVVSTWAAGLAGRRPGGALRIGLRYVEVFFPAVVAAVLLLVFVDYLIGLAIIGYSYPDRPTDLRDFPYEAGAVAFACALAGLAYLGQTRAWPWWQRAAAYTAWLAPFGVFVLAWLTRVK